MIGRLLGRYRIVEQIGAGGMGVVYRAYDEELHRDVAIKVLAPGTVADEDSRRQLRSEALAVARLNHSNIAMAFDFGCEQGIDFLVTEYIAGVTLDEKLQTSAPFPEKVVLDLGIQVASGLEVAHREGIIHRDLKPGNLRVKEDGTIKILDFGLAKTIAPVDAGGSTITLGDTQPFKGTMPYMSPEQVRSETGDQRSDIWAAGAVLYEMATGKRAFPQTTPAEIIDAIRQEDPIRPCVLNPKISPALESLILKALEKEADRRYQTAREMRVDLTRILGGEATTVDLRNRTPIKRNRRAGDRRLPFILGVVLLLGIVAGYLGYRYFQSAPASRQQIMAVLPFDTVGQDDATKALARGLTDTVTAKLVQASNSNKVQLVSPREMRDEGVKTADDARREFGTDLILEGTLEKSGSLIRINLYLVDSKTRRQLEARSFTVAETDSFGLQDQVVSEALAMLPTKIQPEDRQLIATSPDTKPAAYESYIRGRGYLLDYEKSENIDSAIAEFEHAIQIDPKYGAAYARLGEAYWIGYQQLNKGKEWLAKASNSCRQGLALAPQLSESFTCLGHVNYETGKYEEAAQQFQHALDLDPNSDTALEGLAGAYGRLGNPSAAEAAYKKAVVLRPNYWGVYSWLGAFYYGQGRYSEAATNFRKVTELAPGNYRGYSNLSAMYLLQGLYQQALEAAARSVDLRPNSDAFGNMAVAYFLLHRFPESVTNCQEALKLSDNDPLNWGNLGDALYWAAGRRAEAAPAYKKAIALARAKLELNPRDATSWTYVAEYSAMIGDAKAATESLQHALAISPTDPEVLFRTALVYKNLGDVPRALDYLQHATDAGWPRTITRDTPDFASLSENSSFQKIVSSR